MRHQKRRCPRIDGTRIGLFVSTSPALIPPPAIGVDTVIVSVNVRNDGGIFAGGRTGGEPSFSVILCNKESPFCELDCLLWNAVNYTC